MKDTSIWSILTARQFDSNNWPGFPVISADNTLIVGDTVDNTTLISYENNRVRAISGDGCEGQELNLYWCGVEDLDGDTMLDYRDLALLTADWLKCTDCSNPACSEGLDPRGRPRVTQKFQTGDINKDRYVHFADFALLADKWLMGY
jgi:hypothetical protein